MSFEDSNVVYGFLSKFYDLFDLIFLLGGKVIPVPDYWSLLAIPGCESWMCAWERQQVQSGWQIITSKAR
jgi:hypothetical protein